MRYLNKNRYCWLYNETFLLTNMTIFLNFYIFIYFATLIILNFLILDQFKNKFNNFSLNNLLLYILKFNKLKTIIFLLLLSLSGLPPFILFFIKFNFLINLLYKTNFFIIMLIFIIFFLNMIFYIQTFFNKNQNLNLKLIKLTKKNYHLNLIYFIIFFIFLNFLSIFFFIDFYFIFKLINGNI